MFFIETQGFAPQFLGEVAVEEKVIVVFYDFPAKHTKE